MTTTNSKFQGNVTNATDLIYATLSTQSSRLTKKLGKGVVAIYFSNLEEYGFTPEQFLKLVQFLETKNHDLRLIAGYDEDASTHWDNVGDISIPEPPICIIKLSEKFEANYLNGESGKAKNSAVSKDNKITKLTLIGSKDLSKYKVIINDDYNKAIEVSKHNPHGTWAVLWAVANGEPKDSKLYKARIEYLNTNKECPLYTQTSYNLSQILGDRLGQIVSKVKIETRTNKTLAQRSKAT